jgi:type IV secretion system protein VirB11
MSERDAVLESKLEPLLPLLKRKNVEEINANEAGEVILDIAGRGCESVKDPRLTVRYWDELCHILANKAGTIFNVEKQPVVSTRLPGGHRFEAMLGKTVVETGVSVSIRVKRNFRAELESFGLSGDCKHLHDDLAKHGAAGEPAGTLLAWPSDVKVWLGSQVAAGRNILVSGGTSSGKTTLLNALVQFIPKERRVLCVEDTREIDLPHIKNKNFFVVSRNEANPNVGYGEVFDHMMRSHPEIIITGELSIKNAYSALLLMNSGHRGFMCTMHANNARMALHEGFYQRITLNGRQMIKRDLVEYLYSAIDLVIHCGLGEDGRRQVLELWEPGRFALEHYEVAAA